MENQKNDNLNLLEAVVQNTEMGKNTLEQIVPMTEDVQFKAELLRQRNVYHQLNQEAHTAIEACGGTAQGQSAMAKLNTKMGIGIKTLTDKSTRNLAEMLTQGSGMGVVDCVKAQKDYPNAAPGAKRLAQRLQEFLEDCRVMLDQYLYGCAAAHEKSDPARQVQLSDRRGHCRKSGISFYSASTIAATILVAVATYSAMLNFFTTSTS